ncbi:unnamed protein product [Didymodactylos carnosus]|uniref:MAM domain-containing protein n=1 Tax=Didymodactylos carnosus TaxID=1234261 RepID=A0A814AJV1_9BILA|nr:unnamed protein product [Didymodactylos carnosus]CAF0914638.1 unnamed protein product [Didymodactylos carnosus]CAF3638464.1 unnamed protein product [Didymodactylos carnosus]CAF3695068.1 unnamed protein product [Didymodactylos carnosus]
MQLFLIDENSHTQTVRLLSTKVVADYDCTFEQDMCGWTQGQNTSLDWFREQPASNPLAGITGPLADHTYANTTGYYAASKLPLSVIRLDAIHISALVSPRLPNNISNSICAQWWYMMVGTQKTVLSLNLISNENLTSKQSVWIKAGDQGRHWQHGQVQIVPGNNITRVIYEVVADSLSDVSLDDLELIDGPCIRPVYSMNCTFEEKHICGYSSDPSGQLAWIRDRGSTVTLFTGPNHTLGTAQGYFMYIDASSSQKPGDKGRLVSIIEQPVNGRCLEFWYHMYGKNIGQLNVYITTNASGNYVRTLLWSRGANVGNVWRKAHISTENINPFRVVFEGVIGNGYEGDIAIDDIARLAKSCKEPNNCDYEDVTFCAWENVQKTDQFDWEITNGSSSSTLSSGPLFDHTVGTGDGSYAFIDTSQTRKINDTAILISQSITDTGSNGLCMKFFYHMYGVGIGVLTVYLQKEGYQPMSIWTLSGEQEDNWLQGKVGFVMNSEHSIIIEAKVTSESGDGNIGIDDISITNGYCPTFPAYATPADALTTATPAITTMMTTPPCLSNAFDCDFENDTCSSWQLTYESELSWTRIQAIEASQEDADNSIYDHTGNNINGYYLLLKSNKTKPFPNNSVSTQYRSLTMNNNRQCLEFWYFMYGSHVGILSVLISSGLLSQLRWTATGGKGYEWYHAQVNLQSSLLNSTQFNVDIEGIWSADNHGSIAIDDIILLNGTCKTSPDQCDFDSDNSICGFQYSSTGQFNWIRSLASVVNSNVDHSTQTTAGYYMLAEGKNRNVNDRALLLTPRQDRTTGSCLQFWYFEHALTQQLKLNIVLSPQSSLLWSHAGSSSNRWLYAEINIHSPSQSWQAVFVAEVLTQNLNASVAIDDVSITRGSCPKVGDCTFEIDLCGWINDDVDVEMDWLVGNGVHSWGTGPLFDHTTNIAEGKYLMIETSAPTKPGDRARLKSVVFDGTNGEARCFRFWYHMYGDSIATLNIYLFNASYNRIWSLSGNRGNNWYEGQVSYVSLVPHQILVEGITGRDYTVRIY